MMKDKDIKHRFGQINQDQQQSETGKTTQPPPTQMNQRDKNHGEGGPGNQNFRADPRREGLLTDRGDNK
jgi:hypothetical protein